ncbi:MAG: AbrB/MazE/SpoVT family DNA-binding domain-containing protein [Roseiflexaceae bacterium]|nr:AbrB/MazE/SpoVT family DNA-binding domain-containing protein [Roseiflexaceae bacterium]
MAATIRTRLIKIGNSQGVRIPKLILDQLAFADTIELIVDGEQLILRPSAHPRANWPAQFQQMAAAGDDTLLDPDLVPTTWDESDWEW